MNNLAACTYGVTMHLLLTIHPIFQRISECLLRAAQLVDVNNRMLNRGDGDRGSKDYP